MTVYSQSPWLRLTIVLLIALLARLSLGAETTTAPRMRTEQDRVSRETLVVVYDEPSRVWDFSAGPGLAVTENVIGWAIQFNTMTKVLRDSPLYAGLDVGVNVWHRSFSVAGAGVSTEVATTGLPILATAVYRFTISPYSFMHPYVGLSVGPQVQYTRVAPSGSLTGTSRTETSVLFEALLRAGVAFDLSRNVALQIEPKAGLLRDKLIFLPTLTLSVGI